MADAKQIEIKAWLLPILRRLLPGQHRAYDPLCNIISRCVLRVQLPTHHAEKCKPHIESFLLAAPSGTGKTEFATGLSAELNHGQEYFSLMDARGVANNPGNTIHKAIAETVEEWKAAYEAQKAAARGNLQFPIGIIVVDELDGIGKNFFNAFNFPLGGKLTVARPKGAKVVQRLPNGWAFIFVFVPNQAADRFLQRLPIDDTAHFRLWRTVWEHLVNHISRLNDPAVQRRVCKSAHLAEKLVLLYKLQGAPLIERCQQALRSQMSAYHQRQNLVLHFDADAEYQLALWSEDQVPVFDQINFALMNVIGHLHDADVRVKVLADGTVTASILDGLVSRAALRI